MKCFLALLLTLSLLCGAAFSEAAPDLSRVADPSEMTEVQDIVPEGMVPVTADALNDGVYDGIAVDSSSSMFRVVGCTLTVKGGHMTALLQMKSDAYRFLYPGAAEDAARAAKEDLFPLMPLDDSFGFVFPVDALNAGLPCAAFSARKQAWYPRTLMLRADSLPLEAWRELQTPKTLGLADGDYSSEVTLTGGSMAVRSPAAMRIENGDCTAELVFETRRIDYVIVDGQKYEPASTEDGAVFQIPVAAFGVGLSIAVDSTALNPPVEVPCTVTFSAPVS